MHVETWTSYPQRRTAIGPGTPYANPNHEQHDTSWTTLSTHGKECHAATSSGCSLMSKFFFLIARARLTTTDHTSIVWSACQEPEDKVAGDTAQRRPESGVWVWSTVHSLHVHTELGACFHNATTRPGSMAMPVWHETGQLYHMGQFMLLLGRGYGAYLSPHFRCARAHRKWPIGHSLPHHGRAGHMHKSLCWPWPEMEHCTKWQQVRSRLQQGTML